jgi:site-specific DNA recombinase
VAREGLSLAAQEDRLRAYCVLQGFHLVAIFRDEGVSAGKPLAQRPAGAQLLKVVKQGRAKNVLAVKLDRPFRDAIDCMSRATEWDAAGVGLHLLDMGGPAVDTRSAAGRFMLHVLAAAAEMERNRIREGTRDVLAHKKQKGDRLGTTPLGFVTPRKGARMKPQEEELAAVRHILRRRGDDGASFRVIAHELDAQSLPTKRGGSWHPSTVRAIWEPAAATFLSSLSLPDRDRCLPSG